MAQHGARTSGASQPPPMAALAPELEHALQRHVIQPWFPRCLDREHGGFLCAFDRRWAAAPDQPRMLEFQARQTRAAARLARFSPGDGRFAEYALHGFRYLRDAMWDAPGGGGWFWRTTPAGEPEAGGTKHAHSMSYAVQACSLVFEATGERDALELAGRAFEWFDRHAHDDEYGGYHGWLRRDGSVIRSVTEVPAGADPEDPLGHDVGLKDINVHGDWFESLFEFSRVSSSALVGQRLAELTRIYLERLTNAAGENFYAFSPDWRLVPGPEWFGYGFQAANRMFAAANQGEDGAVLRERAEALLLHTTRRSALRAGFAFSGAHGAGRPWPSAPFARRRAWWVQVEALRAFALAMVAGGPRSAAYGRMLERQWQFIQREMLDQRYGGMFPVAASDLRPWQRPGLRRGGRQLRKGDVWKDVSHEVDCWVTAIGVLRAL
jgi:mannobiose 2-epimerase